MMAIVLGVETPTGRRRRVEMYRQLLSPAYALPCPVHVALGPLRTDASVGAWLGDGAATACRYGDEEARAAVHVLSVVGALRAFLDGPHELLLLAEDDAAFAADIGAKLRAAVATWRATAPSSHVLRLGYLPFAGATDAASLWPDARASPRLPPPHAEFAIFLPRTCEYKLVGMQASVLDRVAADALVQTLGTSYADARAALDAGPQAPRLYSSGWPVITDHLLHLPQLAAAFVVPPLAIESRGTPSIFGSQHAEVLWAVADRVAPRHADGYFSAPSNAAHTR